MASNDMEVLMYKILRYLYECLKNTKDTKLEDFAWYSKLMDVPKEYWMEVIKTLVEKGYIEGFKIIGETKSSKLHIQTDQPFNITFDGICFLNENSRMKEAKEFCSESFNVLLSASIGVII